MSQLLTHTHTHNRIQDATEFKPKSQSCISFEGHALPLNWTAKKKKSPTLSAIPWVQDKLTNSPHTHHPLPHWAALQRGWYRSTESSYLLLSVCPQGSRSPQAQLSVPGPSPRYGPADLTPKASVNSLPSHHLQPSLSTQGRQSAARVWGQLAR